MIPEFTDVGGPWQVLPPGIHPATMEEIVAILAFNDHRRRLLAGFSRGLAALRGAGCRRVFLDGSFVTAKPYPRDYDACWDTAGVIETKLDPVFLDFSDNRAAQKREYLGEYFPSTFIADGRSEFIDFFQVEKHTGKPKGIVQIQERNAGKEAQ